MNKVGQLYDTSQSWIISQLVGTILDLIQL